MSRLINSLARRRWLKRIIHPLLPAMNSLDIEGKGNFYYCTKDFTGPSFYVMFDGEKAFFQYEKINKDSIEKSLDNSKVFFDIGSNIGLFSIYFKLKYPDLEVHAFEPEPLNNLCLESSINSFKLNNFKLNKLGLSNEECTTNLYVDPVNMGGASVSQYGKDRIAVTINISTLDKYVATHQVKKIDVIKIDVEGLEEKIIEGGVNTLKNFKPLIIFECIHNELHLNNVVRAILKVGEKFSIEQVKTKRIINPEDFENFVESEFKNGLIGTEYLIRFE